MTSQVGNTHVFVLMFEDEDSHAFEALVDAIATSFLNHVLHALQKNWTINYFANTSYWFQYSLVYFTLLV